MADELPIGFSPVRAKFREALQDLNGLLEQHRDAGQKVLATLPPEDAQSGSAFLQGRKHTWSARFHGQELEAVSKRQALSEGRVADISAQQQVLRKQIDACHQQSQAVRSERRVSQKEAEVLQRQLAIIRDFVLDRERRSIGLQSFAVDSESEGEADGPDESASPPSTRRASVAASHNASVAGQSPLLAVPASPARSRTSPSPSSRRTSFRAAVVAKQAEQAAAAAAAAVSPRQARKNRHRSADGEALREASRKAELAPSLTPRFEKPRSPRRRRPTRKHALLQVHSPPTIENEYTSVSPEAEGEAAAADHDQGSPIYAEIVTVEQEERPAPVLPPRTTKEAVPKKRSAWTPAKPRQCALCNKTAYIAERVEIDGAVYHKACLKCSQCQKVLSLSSYAAFEGRFFCKPHYRQAFLTNGDYKSMGSKSAPSTPKGKSRKSTTPGRIRVFEAEDVLRPSPVPGPPPYTALNTTMSPSHPDFPPIAPPYRGSDGVRKEANVDGRKAVSPGGWCSPTAPARSASHSPQHSPRQKVNQVAPVITAAAAAASGLESTPSKKRKASKPIQRSLPHFFSTHTTILKTRCHQCGHSIGFKTKYLRCSGCGWCCHLECEKDVQPECGLQTPAKLKPKRRKVKDEASTPGTVLEAHFGEAIPEIVTHLITHIEQRGMAIEGLYRISGQRNKVEDLRQRFFNGSSLPNLACIEDMHELTGCLKLYLRSLKEPLLTVEYYDTLMAAMDETNAEDRIALVIAVLSHLPSLHFFTLQFLMTHLVRVAAEKHQNRMSANALSVIFAPVLMRSPTGDIVQEARDANRQRMVVEALTSLSAAHWEKAKEAVEQEMIASAKLQAAMTPATSAASSAAASPSTTPKKRRKEKTPKKERTPRKSPFAFLSPKKNKSRFAAAASQ